MSLANRVESLKAKHAALDEALSEHARRPTYDTVTVSELKRKKLAIKEELDRIVQH